MPRTPCRNFTLADAMILVAATAVSFATIRFCETNISDTGMGLFYSYSGIYTVPLAACVSAGWLLIRLRQSRPSRTRLFRQPGMAAISSALLIAALYFMVIGGTIIFSRSPIMWHLRIFYLTPLWAGPAVISSWLVLILTKVGMREPGWIDRTGCILGMAWIFLMGLSLLDIPG